ncbi:ribokinase [Allorhizobium undicola]|uniref:ribokinase n=1 Tax=Allorhizobium undicola TaxID=78527 RepID=UPI0004814FD5|nr:ribokinase [Allorhizobium undicola]
MITVFGSINMDLIATTTRLPKPGETVAGTGFATAAGGKGANQALAARRAGAEVRMVGAVGADQFAAPSLELLRQAGTDLTSVRTVEGPTGTALILVEQDGENMITVIPAANASVTSADASATVKAMTGNDSLVLQLEIPADAVETALIEAKAAGIRTILNLAPLTEDAARLGGLADMVIANETEFERLAGETGLGNSEREAALKRLHAQSGQTLIITLGADGVMAIRDGQIVRAKGLKIEPVDTVGAGDTFCGYLAASVDAGMEFEAALRRAAVAGSLACLKAGAQPAIPSASDVEPHL